jgi:hypothetical protein
MRNVIGWILLCVGLVARPAFSQELSNGAASVADAVPAEPADAVSVEALAEQSPAPPAVAPQQPALHPVAIDYGRGYEVRGQIHRYASYTTLPLFAGDIIIGQSLLNQAHRGEDPSHGENDVHIALGAAIGGLFAVNSVTGVWNLVQSRKDPEHRGLRLAHGLMMLGADAGIFASVLTAPSTHERNGAFVFERNPAHRPLALTSIGVATASYLMMLIAER